jgi:hypothetical protein
MLSLYATGPLRSASRFDDFAKPKAIPSIVLTQAASGDHQRPAGSWSA